jgi:hypothetical protein
MEEARAVLARLERIEALDRTHGEPGVLLGELRELVREVEIWARCERESLVWDPLPRAHSIGARVDAVPLNEGSAA